MDAGVAAALDQGDVSLTTKAALLDTAATFADCADQRAAKVREALAGGPVSWDPSHDQPRFRLLPGEGLAVLRANASAKNHDRRGDPLVVAGLRQGRTLAFAANPVRSMAVEPSMDSLVRRGIDWLTDGASAGDFTVVIAHATESRYFPDETRTRGWLDATYGESVSYNAADACDADALAGCLDGADLLILSQSGEVDVDAVRTARDAGVGVLYFHTDGGRTGSTNAVLPLLGVEYAGDQYWVQPTAETAALETGGATVSRDLQTLMQGIDEDTINASFTDCEDHACADGSVYEADVRPVVEAMSARLMGLDRAGKPLFDQGGRTLDKTAVLLADLHKAELRFPFDAATAPRQTVLKARFADHAQVALRSAAPAFTDLGNHGRSDTDVPMINASVSMQARRPYRSTGLYARPGEPVTVTRTDAEPISTWVRVNIIRDTATRVFGRDGYTRPGRAATTWMPVAPGESLTLTSAHGGPIFIEFDRDQNGQTVSFDMTNVAQHPVWRGPEDDAAFTAAVDGGLHDWAEIITPGFEVHSRTDRMQETLGRGMAPSDIARLTALNFTDHAHALAGFTGRGITEVADIHGWAREQGIPLSTIDVVKHMNADQSACGSGCSGNPYDAFWAFDPLGHGDLHELGHGLERKRLLFEGQELHTITNPYSYYAKRRFVEDEGGATECQSLPYQTLFERAQAAARTDDPAAAMREHDHNTWSFGAAINHQTMMGAQALGLLDDGAHLLGRLHTVERAFKTASQDGDAWAEQRAALGFAGWSREDARNLGQNDWLLIATSHALGRDMTDWFTVWGHAFGEAATAHTAPLPDFPVRFFVAGPRAQCEGFPTESLPIDGTSQWPESMAKASAPVSYKAHDAHDACALSGAR